VRKLMTVLLALPLAGVPAALAAGGPERAAGESRSARASDRIERPAVTVNGWTTRARAVQAWPARRAALRKAKPRVAVPPQLRAIAECESHGNPKAIGGGGLYRGKYQMSRGAWAGVGGKGDPAKASEAEQDRRALMLYERSGPGQWPACGG
jgi:Transglycosylase-like domain